MRAEATGRGADGEVFFFREECHTSEIIDLMRATAEGNSPDHGKCGRPIKFHFLLQLVIDNKNRNGGAERNRKKCLSVSDQLKPTLEPTRQQFEGELSDETSSTKPTAAKKVNQKKKKLSKSEAVHDVGANEIKSSMSPRGRLVMSLMM